MDFPPVFDVAIIPEGRSVRVAPIGEVDLATCGALRARLDELWSAGTTDLILDLREVTFMDSTGLATLVEHHRRAAGDGVRFSIIDGPEPVTHVLQIAGLHAMLAHAQAPEIA